MIGNDIIDLRLAEKESNWQRKGYLGKIFTAAEQEMICEADSPAGMVWLLWSCKEAAYKIVNRITSIRVYNPARFNCTFINKEGHIVTGVVQHEARKYSFTSYRDSEHIHTVAVANAIFLSDLEIYAGNTMPASLFGGSSLIKNQDGIPYLLSCCSYSPTPVSISHHGDYVGIVKRKTI